jgi:hypothetical protein
MLIFLGIYGRWPSSRFLSPPLSSPLSSPPFLFLSLSSPYLPLLSSPSLSSILFLFLFSFSPQALALEVLPLVFRWIEEIIKSITKGNENRERGEREERGKREDDTLDRKEGEKEMEGDNNGREKWVEDNVRRVLAENEVHIQAIRDLVERKKEIYMYNMLNK